MRHISFPNLFALIAVAAAPPASASVIEAQFRKPIGFPNNARCVVEIFVGEQFCTGVEAGEPEQWHAALRYDFDPTQKTAKATFRITGTADWAFRRPEKVFTVASQVGLGVLTPEPREKVVSNGLKTSRDVTESSGRQSSARIEKATESLKGAAAAATTNKDKAEVLVEWNELADVSNKNEDIAKDFVVSELPKLRWKSFNPATRKGVFIAASGVAEKFTEKQGGKKNTLGLYGEAADAIPEAAQIWDTILAQYAKVNPDYRKAIANPPSDKVAEYGSERAFKEQIFRESLYGSKN